MRKAVFLSGAGISAESGIGTFRDSGGLWENHDVMEVCSDIGFRADRRLVLDFYDARRGDLADKLPNKAHYMVAGLQAEFPGRVLNLTQNVDDLFEKAGCESVVHLHGELTKTRCEACDAVLDIGYAPIGDGLRCPACGSARMRHHVVMFGEAAPAYAILQSALARAAAEDSLLVVVGTSGQVLPVASYAAMVRHSILNNLEAVPDVDARAFGRVFYGKAGECAKAVGEAVREFLLAGEP